MSKISNDEESASDGSEERLGYEDGSEFDSEAEEGHALLDTMAAEGDESEEESEESDQDAGDDVSISPKPSFSKFSHLPLELRHRIWEYFCPSLTLSSRMFEFHFARMPIGIEELSDSNYHQSWLLQDGITLSDHTKAIRTVLAVNKESRELALKQFPHALDLDAGPNGDAIVRFNRDKDIINLNGHLTEIGLNDHFLLSNFPEQVKSIVIGEWEDKDIFEPGALARLLEHFPNLETVFLCKSGGSCRKSNLKWCKSDMVIRYYIETFEKEPGLGEDLQSIFCWPDHRNHADFARFQIPEDIMGVIPELVERTLQQMNARALPMVLFELDNGMRRFESLPEYFPTGQNEDSDDSTSEEDEEEGTDINEYESDGIDDGPILGEWDSEEDGEISIDGQDEIIRGSQSDGDTPEARFSSPEPDPVNRTRKRRVVEDSDDDSDDAPEQPAAKRARTRVVSSDTESDGGNANDSQGAKSQESSESEDGDGSNNGKGGESGESGESESESEEEAPAPLSLAERLNAHRQENPIESEDEDENESSEMNSDDNEGDDDDSDDPSENALLADMAEEDESEDDEVEEYPEYDAF